MFNPKVKDFLEDNENKTLIGLYWSMYWRFTVMVYGVIIIIGIIIALTD